MALPLEVGERCVGDEPTNAEVAWFLNEWSGRFESGELIGGHGGTLAGHLAVFFEGDDPVLINVEFLEDLRYRKFQWRDLSVAVAVIATE